MTQACRPRPLRLIATGVVAAALSFAAPAIAQARPATGVERVKGNVVDAAVSGDGIVIARQSPGGRVVVERRVRGHASVVLAADLPRPGHGGRHGP